MRYNFITIRSGRAEPSGGSSRKPGELRSMANGNKKFRLKRKAWIEPDMMESEAFRSLSGKGMWVLLRFYQKRTWEKGKTSSRRRVTIYQTDGLVFTYVEALEFGISKAQFHRIIKELVEKGFIEVQHQGGGVGRDYSRYRLSDGWKKYGTPEFEKVTKRRVLQQGLDVQTWKAKREEERRARVKVA